MGILSGPVSGSSPARAAVTGVHADVAARDVCADKADADILAGIYMNAGGGEGSLTAYDPSRPFAAASRRPATLLQHSVLSRLNAAGLDIPDDGVVSDIGLGSGLRIADAVEQYFGQSGLPHLDLESSRCPPRVAAI
jgi:hypothetical protein